MLLPRRQSFVLPYAVVLLYLTTVPGNDVSAEETPEAGGKYLHADTSELTSFNGRLQVTFKTPAQRIVIAYGRRYRKPLRRMRGTLDKKEEQFKPFKAEMTNRGKHALFRHLPPDHYDLVVIQPADMLLLEGIQLLSTPEAETADADTLDAIASSLGRQDNGRIAWEAFFEEKQFERGALMKHRAAAFVQQMRPRTALTGGGSAVNAVIHSIDVVWLQRALEGHKGWQATVRQQLYRAALPTEKFFTHKYTEKLTGIRVVNRRKEIGPLAVAQLMQKQ